MRWKRLLIGKWLLLPVLTVSLLFSSVACGADITTEDLQGLLQSMEGKEMVITLDDGTIVRIRVESSLTESQGLVGEQVSVRVRLENGIRELEEVERRGEDSHFSGTIESMSADSWVIGGRTFQVNATTELDGGLAVGVLARVEFLTLDDASLLATEIETDEEDEHFNGIIESISTDAWVIAGQTFRVSSATRLDEGLAVGVLARVEFTSMPDGSMLAIEIETDEDDDNHFSGTIESMSADNWVIGGRTFQVNAATVLDNGLAIGVPVRVEFITLEDGSLLATEIETDEIRFFGVVESIGTDAWVVGGQTFQVNAATRIENGLAVGTKVRVRFTMMNDSMLATRIEVDKSGRGNQQEFRGTIESIGTDAWIIDERTFLVNEDTELEDGLAVGIKAKVKFIMMDGSIKAIRIRVDKSGREDQNDDNGIRDDQNDGMEAENESEGGENAHFIGGVIESMSADTWIIGGRTFKVDSTTILDDGLVVGVEARVEFITLPDGSLLATEIETDADDSVRQDIP